MKIKWSEPQRTPIIITVRKLNNGFLLGETYYANEDEFISALVKGLKDPYEKLDVLEYHRVIDQQS